LHAHFLAVEMARPLAAIDHEYASTHFLINIFDALYVDDIANAPRAIASAIM
jgi:hypothetical protein